jgi:hypothetical protein
MNQMREAQRVLAIKQLLWVVDMSTSSDRIVALVAMEVMQAASRRRKEMAQLHRGVS